MDMKPGDTEAECIFTEKKKKHNSINGPMQFKPVLLKGQLYSYMVHD